MSALLSEAYDALEPVCHRLAARVLAHADQLPYEGIHQQALYLVETARALITQPLRRDPPAALNRMIPHIAPAITYLSLLDTELDPFLIGEVTGEQIVKRAGKEAWMAYNYAFIGTAVLAEGVTALAGPLCSGRNVLELGGGTGATTTRIAPYLREVKGFRFTDVKEQFLQAAASYVIGHTPIETRYLDLNARPQAEAQYDLIYATNVLHVAKDIFGLMYWLNDSLLSGGYLIFGEGSPYSPAGRWPLDLLFSLFKGWWNVPRTPHRPHPGFLLPAAWKAIGWAAGLRLRLCTTLEDDTRIFGSIQVWQKE